MPGKRLPAKPFARKHNQVHSLRSSKPCFEDRCLSRKQEMADSVSGSQIRQTVLAASKKGGLVYKKIISDNSEVLLIFSIKHKLWLPLCL